jgi:GT2 family glycosyltransferase/Flp pilus assembly protein TadD
MPHPAEAHTSPFPVRWSDEELVVRARTGPQGGPATNALWQRYHGRLRRFANWWAGQRGLQPADGDEVEQEAGVAFFRALARYELQPPPGVARASFRTFLKRVVQGHLSRWLTQLLQDQGRREPNVEASLRLVPDPRAEDPATEVEWREDRARLDAALGLLDEEGQWLWEQLVAGRTLRTLAIARGDSPYRLKREKRRVLGFLAQTLNGGSEPSAQRPGGPEGVCLGRRARSDRSRPGSAARQSMSCTWEEAAVSRRYLFGPISAAFADQNLHGPRQQGHCLAFSTADGPDLTVGANEPWEALCSRFPAGWQPDLVVLNLAYAAVPAGLWRAPVPLIGLAPDWNLLWHQYRHQLPRVDLVLTDRPGVEALARAGIAPAVPANLFGLERAWLEETTEEAERDVDVLFVGNFHPAVQRERLAWLGRLGRLAERWRVVLATGAFDADYRRLLRRARVVFNRSIRGECNRRAFEAAAAGALLFQEASNQEVPAYFRDRRECVLYGDDDLEALLEHYLTHEDERRTVARAGQERVRDYGYEALWTHSLKQIEARWEDLSTRATRRVQANGGDDLLTRTWQVLSGGHDPTLTADLDAALRGSPENAALHNAWGLALVQAGRRGGPVTATLAERAAGHFRRALACEATHVVAGLNLAEALVGLEQTQAAIEQARQTLALLEGPATWSAEVLDAGHFPPEFDLFRVEWERVAWANAGRSPAEAEAKRTLLRWRLHQLLAELTGNLAHHYEAALARPDLPSSRAALGCVLGQAGHAAAAVPHLRVAVEANPFDRSAARALCQALTDAGVPVESRRLARDRRLLARAAPGLVPSEAWFTEAAPVGDELASLIVLCCNELAYTRQCLESVLAHTRAPYELVLVDNGSTDGTPTYLEELRQRRLPERVVVVRNEANQGFPRGCNQGLAEARGRYVVFLNNDVVVTEGWLEGLIAHVLSDWPKVGLVGAVTNASRPPQQIPVDYADLAGMPAFAARRRQEFAGKTHAVERLTGFCLLVRREVLDRIGGFDEGFGAGFFDDDDLSVRAGRAGFRLVVAQDTYVHHYGSRTFTGLGIDCPRQLRDNFARFQEKWGPEESAGYRFSDGAPVASEAAAAAAAANGAAAPTVVVAGAGGSGRPRVSLCMIVRNEEANLPDCLRSVADLVDEIVVVDTGSTDATREVACRFGAKVVDFPWCDSFAAARNESLRHASGEWAFWLDADDRLNEDNRAKLRVLFASLNGENVAYALKCLCPASPSGGAATVVDHVRLFRNHPALHWEYRVHEQILPAIRRQGGQVRWTDVVVHHAGYQDPALRGRKLERDLRLLRLENEEKPDDPFTLFNLGSVSQELGRCAEALPLLRRSLERSHPQDSIVRKLYALIASCHRALGQSQEALAACREGRTHYPDDAELLFDEGLLLRETGDLAGAEACLLRLLAAREGGHFASVDTGLRGYKTRHNLAVVYHQQGRHAEARAQWQAVVAERSDFVPGWLGLAEVCLRSRTGDELEAVAQQLERLPQGPLEAAVLRARGLMIRQEFRQARALLAAVVAAHPEALGPRIYLSHALLQEGHDLDAAEEALRALLALDPGNREAQHNLAVLLRQRRQGANDVFAGGGGLAALYDVACREPSDVNEHLPTLYALAKECEHVTELGTRGAVSTTALLYAQPKKLVCYDRVKCPPVDKLAALAGETEFVFHQDDVLWVTIEETDLLFIDTWHVYEQLSEELRLHASAARKYVVLHDTTTFGEQGEAAGHRGLWPAVEEFLAQGTFRLKQRFTHNNGLTVLERIAPLPTA